MKVFKSTKPVQDERFQRGCEKLREYKEGKGGLITKMDMNSEISKICSEICEENDKNINGLNVENVIKKYNILTKVDGNGGKISGQNDEVYETVTYYGNSKKDIVITPDYGYKISSIKVNDIDI